MRPGRIAYALFALCLLAQNFMPARADYDVPSYDEGVNLMGRRDFDGAINEFNRAIGYNQRNGKAFFKRGQCFYYLQNFQLAVDDFGKAISCDPQNSEYYLWKGATYSKMGDNPHSIRDYEEALRIDPKLLAAANGAPLPEPTGLNSPMFAGGSRRAEGDGVGMFQQQDQGRNGIVMEEVGRGRGRGRFRQNQFAGSPRQGQAEAGRNVNEQSIRNYNEAVRIVNNKIAPTFVSGSIFGGIVRPEFKDDEKSPFLRPDGLNDIVAKPKDAFDAARSQIEKNPRDPAAHFRRGLALAAMGKSEKAISEFNDAIDQQSNNGEYILARAFAFHMSNDETAANEDIARAHGVDPEIPAVIKFVDTAEMAKKRKSDR